MDLINRFQSPAWDVIWLSKYNIEHPYAMADKGNCTGIPQSIPHESTLKDWSIRSGAEPPFLQHSSFLALNLSDSQDRHLSRPGRRAPSGSGTRTSPSHADYWKNSCSKEDSRRWLRLQNLRGYEGKKKPVKK